MNIKYVMIKDTQKNKMLNVTMYNYLKQKCNFNHRLF